MSIKDLIQASLNKNHNPNTLQYPFKIVAVDIFDTHKPTEVTFRGTSLNSIVKTTIQEMFDDPDLIEKFSPENIKLLSFLGLGEVLFKDKTYDNPDDVRTTYLELIKKMIQFKV